MSNDRKISPVEIEGAMFAALKSMQNDCESRIAALDSSAKNEKKALNVEKGMYRFCSNAGMLSGVGGDRERIIPVKADRLTKFISDPKLAETFDKADDEEKLRLSAAFYGIVWMKSEVLPQYIREYEQAKESGDVRSQFEQQIKLKTITAVIRKWIELAESFGYGGLCEVPHGR